MSVKPLPHSNHFTVLPPRHTHNPNTHPTQACTANGKVGLFLLRASRIAAAAAGTDILLTLEPVPPSRYILDVASRSCAVVSPPAHPPAEAGEDRGGSGSPRRSDAGGAAAPDAGAAPGFPRGLVGCPLGNGDGVGGDGRGAGVITAAEVAVAAAGVREETAALFPLPSLEALAALRSGSLRAWWLESGRRLAAGGLGEEEEEHGQQRQPAIVSPSPQEEQQQQQPPPPPSPQQQHEWSPWLGAQPLSPLDAAADPWLEFSILDGMFLDDRWELT